MKFHDCDCVFHGCEIDFNCSDFQFPLYEN